MRRGFWAVFMTHFVSRRLAGWAKGVCLLAGSLLIALAAAPVRAQDYPTHLIRIVVPYSAGGASDGPIRVIAQELARQMGQQVLIDNRPGQGAMIGSEIVARAAADGYTLLLGSTPQVISAALYSNLSFDPIEGFAPISLFSREPGVLVVHPSFPARSLKEFIEYVKEHPGTIDYGSSGNGSAQHLFMAMFLSRAGLKMVHIPYRGSAQATSDVIAGQVKVALPGLAAMMSHIKDGRLRPLAVTGKVRSPLLPDVPTLDESGFPGYSAYVWNGLLAPKGTPKPIIDKLNRELLTALNAPAVRAFMTSANIESLGTTPAGFDAFIREEKERTVKVVKETGMRID